MTSGRTSNRTSADLRNLPVRASQATLHSDLARQAEHWQAARWQERSADPPHTEAFIELLEAFRATGGTAPGCAVARLLEEHQGGDAVGLADQGGRAAGLAKQVFTRELFGFNWRSNFWIPMFQFRSDDLAVKVEPQQVRAALPSEWSGWAVACWFAAPHIQLEGRRPVDALDADFDDVLRAAKVCESEPRPEPRPEPRSEPGSVPSRH